MSVPEPYLRRGERAADGARGSRAWLWLVLGFLVLLLVAVVVPLVVIGLHNDGVKPPPGPQPTQSVPISRN